MNFKQNNTAWSDEPQAQKTEYNGIVFRSKLEAKTAQAFDNIGIAYEYEPRSYKLTNGLWYKPDFWLPDARQFVECKGVMSSTDSAKIVGLVEDETRPVVALSYDNAMIIMRYYNIPENDVVTHHGIDVALAWCAKCGKPWFMSWSDIYECPNCCTQDGDSHIKRTVDIRSATDLFNYGQQVAADKPIYKEIANNFNK